MHFPWRFIKSRCHNGREGIVGIEHRPVFGSDSGGVRESDEEEGWRQNDLVHALPGSRLIVHHG